MMAQQKQWQQKQQRKFYPCRKGCGTQVTFDNRFKNPDGTKFIPLVQDPIGQLTPHDCKTKLQQQQEQKQQTTSSSELRKKINDTRVLLTPALARLDEIEKELGSFK